MNRLVKIVSVILIVAALIVASYYAFIKEENESLTEEIAAEEEAAAEQRQSRLPVTVMEVNRGRIAQRARISAMADVWEKSTLKAETRGKVEKINPSVGDSVQRNGVLVQLDREEKALDLSEKEAIKLEKFSKYLIKDRSNTMAIPETSGESREDLEASKKKYGEALKEFRAGRMDKKELDRIKMDYEEAMILSGELRDEILKSSENLSQAIIAYDKAKLELERTTVRAPFPGRVTNLAVSPGQMVSAGDELLTLVNLQSLYLRGEALESEIGILRVGLRVRVNFDAYPERYFWGEIQAISPRVDEENKTIPIYIRIDNSENLFYPGMHAEVDVEYNAHEDVIKVPRDAVLNREGRYLIFVEEEGTAIWKYVKLGIKNDEEIEIISGLEEGQRVIVEGQLTLAHQSRVKVSKVIK